MAHIALYFGSFNPIHTGHLIIAESILLQKEIDKVWFVVSPQNPFKKSQGLLNETSRFFLTQLAVENNEHFGASNIEFSLPKPSYTIDTLTYLKEKHPTHTFSLLMGGDNLEHFEKWKNYETIIENYKIYVYKRPDASNQNLLNHPNIIILDVPMIEISSTLIRSRIQKKESIRYLVPDVVREEIEKSGFYK
jgi:nicotinate-nucleotide adenylyltransferase